MTSFVPEQITITLFLTVLFISLLFSLIVGTICSIIEGGLKDIITRGFKNSSYLYAFSFPIALVAYISGYLSTLGRSSAVAQLLPAVLALIGALNLYVFGSENKHRFVISYCICVFAVMLFYGSQFGAFQRDQDQEFRLQNLIAIELRLKNIRHNLGLGDDFPPWIIGAEPK